MSFFTGYTAACRGADHLFLHFIRYQKITAFHTGNPIDAYFDYDEVEHDGLMSADNDVLPYGDQLHIKIKGELDVILDQYCLLPEFRCKDTKSGTPENFLRFSHLDLNPWYNMFIGRIQADGKSHVV